MFRGQRLSPDDQLRFTAHFGDFQLAYSPHRNGATVNYLGKGIAPDGVAGSPCSVPRWPHRAPGDRASFEVFKVRCVAHQRGASGMKMNTDGRRRDPASGGIQFPYVLRS